MLFKFRKKHEVVTDFLMCVRVCLCRCFSVCQQRRLRKKSGFFMTFENILDRGGSHLPIFKQIYYLWTAPITKFWLNQVRSRTLVFQKPKAEPDWAQSPRGWVTCPEISAESNSMQTIRLWVRQYVNQGTPCVHTCTKITIMLKVLESMSEFDGLWNHQNNLACTKMGRNSLVGRASNWKARHNADTGSSPQLHTK